MYGAGLFKGLGITLKNMILPSRQFTTHQYPDRKIGLLGRAKLDGKNPVAFALTRPGAAMKAMVGLDSVPDRFDQHPRFRGEEFSWFDNRCTGCASCAKYCPLGIIKIVTSPSETAVQEGDKYGIEVFDIDIGRCMFCGLCVEACPYDALHMGSGFEEGTYSRADLVINVDRLKASPKKPSQWFRPQLTSQGYNPLVTDGQEASWRDVHRHEKPSQSDQEDKWGQR
ncbi:MAG: 4Fe-4S binding protein [SAR202 cluster bacterium]|jgi:formate hydrogenlyase subunit 6/NADH:ubiquinone oxidoreductase subunit I|nr:4Fe-4S binding protein [SAR202 cluster bacterium]MDP6714379.1 4Fe-4S binding protein [SAR202 cluster bacterium]